MFLKLFKNVESLLVSFVSFDIDLWHICFTRLFQVLIPKLICVAKFCNTWWLCQVTEVLRPKLNSEAKLGTAVVLGTVSSLHQRGEEGAEWVGWVSGVFLIFKVVSKVEGKIVVKVVVVVDVHVVPIDQCDSDKSCLIVDPIHPLRWGSGPDGRTTLQANSKVNGREVLLQMGKIVRQFLPLAKSIFLISIIRTGRWSRPSFTSQGPL